MTRPHLDAPRAAILARLQAGQHPDHIATVGHWLGAWTRADVEAVRGWLRRDADGPNHYVAKPPPPIHHGTEWGWRQHYNRGERPPCEPCRRARQQANERRKSA